MKDPLRHHFFNVENCVFPNRDSLKRLSVMTRGYTNRSEIHWCME